MNVTYERFCFPVTLRCNLKCKLCAEHSPYYKEPYHPLYKELSKQLDTLFQLVENIGKFDITGGEPFLRKDLPEILTYIYSDFREQIGELRVTTNGTLLPTDEFIESARLWGDDIFIIVDNYPVSDKSEAVFNILKMADIPCEQRDYSEDLHCDGWVDYGDLTPKNNKKEATELFHKCMVPKLGFFSCMVNGKVFPCARARLLYEKGILTVCANIFDEKLSNSGKKKRLNDMLGDEVIEACRFCNGLCESSQRFPPAEQLTINKEQAQEVMDYESWHLNYGKVLFYTQTYNNEKTIARTIESILNQTKDDYTYFILNNGSTDNTGQIIRKYAEDNKNIVYIESDQNDMLAATVIPFYLLRYVPEYLDSYFCIVDGDDSIEPDFLERVLQILSNDEVDMIIPAANRIISETGEIIDQRRPSEDMIVSGRKKADEFYYFRPLLLCQWGKVYRWKAFKKMYDIFINAHQEVPKWFHQQDTVGVLNCFYHAEKAAFISAPIYNYYISSSSTYGSYLPGRIRNDVLMFRIYNDFLDKYEPVSKFNRDYCYAIYLSLLYENLNSIYNTNTISEAEKLSDIREIFYTRETQQMLTGEFAPEFNNLAHREDFLKAIQTYLKSLPADMQCCQLVNDIIAELNKYGSYNIN